MSPLQTSSPHNGPMIENVIMSGKCGRLLGVKVMLGLGIKVVLIIQRYIRKYLWMNPCDDREAGVEIQMGQLGHELVTAEAG